MRGPNKKSADVGNQLYSALKKSAKHTRVILIEVNMPDDCDNAKTMQILKQALGSIRDRENKLTIDGQPAPPGYVIVTNNPYQYSLGGSCKTAGVGEGFKIPDFKYDLTSTLREAVKNRQKHFEVDSLLKILSKTQIPSSAETSAGIAKHRAEVVESRHEHRC